VGIQYPPQKIIIKIRRCSKGRRRREIRKNGKKRRCRDAI
jgi:hypothetical protein